MVLRVLTVGLAVAGCDAVTVLARADEAEAARAVRSLEGEQIAARAIRTGRAVDVEVPRAQLAEAVRVLRRDSTCPAAPTPLVGAEADARTRREQALAARLEATLRDLPDVSSARVQITLPAPAAFDVSPGRPRAVAVVRTGASTPDDATLRGLVTAGVEGLRPEDVGITHLPAATPRPPRYAWVGPFAVAPTSASGLRAALAGGLVLVAGLSAALLRRGLVRST
ncbi:MAG: hypothetical protein U0325_13900 [Polyangiales bacterium]